MRSSWALVGVIMTVVIAYAVMTSASIVQTTQALRNKLKPNAGTTTAPAAATPVAEAGPAAGKRQHGLLIVAKVARPRGGVDSVQWWIAPAGTWQLDMTTPARQVVARPATIAGERESELVDAIARDTRARLGLSLTSVQVLTLAAVADPITDAEQLAASDILGFIDRHEQGFAYFNADGKPFDVTIEKPYAPARELRE